jgi:hypothetical protein
MAIVNLHDNFFFARKKIPTLEANISHDIIFFFFDPM